MSRRPNRGRRRCFGSMRNARERGDPRKFRAWGFVYWYRADLSITIGTGVLTWGDLSGNARNATQAVGANQPAYTAANALYAGRPTIDGAGSHWLTGPGWAEIPQPTTMLATAHLTDTAASRCLVDNQTANQFYQWIGPATTQLFAGLGGTTATVAPATPAVLAWRYNGVNSFDRKNGVQSPDTNAGTTGNDGVNIFQYHANVNRWIGSMAELVAYSSALSTSALIRIEHYMGARCGIAA